MSNGRKYSFSVQILAQSKYNYNHRPFPFLLVFLPVGRLGALAFGRPPPPPRALPVLRAFCCSEEVKESSAESSVSSRLELSISSLSSFDKVEFTNDSSSISSGKGANPKPGIGNGGNGVGFGAGVTESPSGPRGPSRLFESERLGNGGSSDDGL